MTDQLTIEQLRPILEEHVTELKAKRKRLKGVKDHLRMEGAGYAPRGVTAEHRYLDALTHSPWGTKLAETYAQELSLSGFRDAEGDSTTNDPAWELFEQARGAIVEDVVIREAFQWGESFCAGLTTEPVDGQESVAKAIAKPLPPYHTHAKFVDPVIDIWPESVLSTTADRKTARAVSGMLLKDEWVYLLAFPEGLDASTATITKVWEHKSPNTPVIRFIAEIDSEGNATGKIAKVLPLLQRIRKDTYDRQVIQHKLSWKVRTATGLEPDETKTREQNKLEIAQGDVLVSSDPNVKFGTLDESPLGDLIAAKEADVFELCSLGTIPPSAVMPGKIANISSETIAELRSGFENGVADHKVVLGDSFDWLMRLMAIQADIEPNLAARSKWQDRSSRSLAQAMDAWTKGVPGLDIPAEGAWARLPGVTAEDRREWANMNRRTQGRANIEAIFNRAQPAPADANAAPVGAVA